MLQVVIIDNGSHRRSGTSANDTGDRWSTQWKIAGDVIATWSAISEGDAEINGRAAARYLDCTGVEFIYAHARRRAR